MSSVHPISDVKHLSLSVRRHARDGEEVINRCALFFNASALKNTGQKTASPILCVILGKAASLGICHYDKTGQVVIL